MPRTHDQPALLDAIRAACIAVWPEVLETVSDDGADILRGIWEITQSKRGSYERRDFPRVLLEIPAAHEASWGMTQTTFEQPLVVYYCDWTENGASLPYFEKLFLLRAYIQEHGLTSGETEFTVLQRWGHAVYDPTKRTDADPNWILYIRNNQAQVGGLVMTVLTGDNAA